MYPPSEHGHFFAIEGCDGSGKSVLGKKLRILVESYGYGVTLTHEPAGTELGRYLTKALSRPDLTAEAEFLLFNAARSQHIKEVILPALTKKNHRVVICDRYVDSTRAYQGNGDDIIDEVIGYATQGLTPVMTFLLIGDVKNFRERAQKCQYAYKFPQIMVPKGTLKNVFEPQIQAKSPENTIARYDSADLESYQRIQDRYLELAELYSHRYCIINSDEQCADDVAAIAFKKVKELLPRLYMSRISASSVGY